MRAFIFAFCFYLFSFMNAIFEPNKHYKVGLHKIKNRLSGEIHVYASTQMYVRKFGATSFRHVHWGVYNEDDNLFIPNKAYILLKPMFKKQLVFPEHWLCTIDGNNKKAFPLNENSTDYVEVPVEQQQPEEYVKKHFENVFSFIKKCIN